MKRHPFTFFLIAACVLLGVGVMAATAARPLLKGGESFANGAMRSPERPRSDTGEHQVCPSGCAYSSVQAAVDAAMDGDVIKVAAGSYSGVSTRAGVTQVVYISKSVTIQGGYSATFGEPPDPEAYPTTLDAQGQGRVFYIAGAISPTLEGLHITGGDAHGLGGVAGGDDAGGGMYVVSGALTMRRSRVFSNSAQLGGGLFISGTYAALHEDSVSGNTAELAGGGLSSLYSDVTLGNSVVSSNTAQIGNGGGMFLESTSAVISDSKLTGNSAGYTGGGMMLGNSTAALRNNTVSTNTSAFGAGGLRLYNTRSVLSGNTVTGNRADAVGGGLVLDNSTGTLSNNVVISNTANTGGGGVYLIGDESVTLVGNTVAHNSSGNGGGLLLSGSAITLSENSVTANTVMTSGGGLFLVGGVFSLTNNLIASNQATASGSGLYAETSSARLVHNTLARNAGGDGSAIFVATGAESCCSVALTNTILVSHGIGISVTAGSTVTLSGVLWHGTPITVSRAFSSNVTAREQRWGEPTFGPDGYHITPGSAAMDAGVDAGVNSDIDGHHRPYGAAPDLGADEIIAAAIDIGMGSTLVFTDTQGSPTIIQLPAGAVTETMMLVFTPVETVTTPLGFAYAGHAFELDAYRDGGLLGGLTLSKPATVTIHYTNSDVRDLDEDTLALHIWDTGAWSDAASTCAPPSSYTRAPEEDWFALPVCHLSRLGAFARENVYDAYLPVLMRKRDALPEPQPTPKRFTRWRAADDGFADWGLDGVRRADDGSLQLDAATAVAGSDPYPPGSYYGRNFYNGGSFLVGEAVGPIAWVPVTATQAIASWNADTPPGTWIEIRMRAQLGDRWSKWYNVGIWAADTTTIERHSDTQQRDADGYVAVDTLVVTHDTDPVSAYQLKVRLFSADGSSVPTLRNAALAASEPPATPGALPPGNPDQWDHRLQVPECSQMVYPDGGRVWCSPTSTSMVAGYWDQAGGPCEPRVRAAVAGVYDWLYDGHGNWPFNTAYAATLGLEAYVVRLTSLAQAEEWIRAGVPVVVSLAWGWGELSGAPLAWSDGHLMVLVGFDADGDPIVNDPGAPSDATVRRTYIREEFESLWLEHTSGTVYLIYPSDWAVPDM